MKSAPLSNSEHKVNFDIVQRAASQNDTKRIAALLVKPQGPQPLGSDLSDAFLASHALAAFKFVLCVELVWVRFQMREH